MLNRGANRWRDWALFAIVASLPAIAMGVLGFWALRNEEAAVRREMRLQVEREAEVQKRRFEQLVKGLGDGAPIDSAPFADAVNVSAAELSEDEAPPDDEGQRCAGWADAMRKGDDQARASILEHCDMARSRGGRMLWPLAALARPGAAPDSIETWLERHGHDLGAAERVALREEIRGESRFDKAARARLLEALGRPDRAAALRSLLAVRRAAMIAGRPVIRWRERASLGALKRGQDGGYQGFVVHAGSLTRALGAGWPGDLPEGMQLRVAGPQPVEDGLVHGVYLLPGLQLVVSFEDPEAVAWRSKAVLIAVALFAVTIALALAALLFARMRRERHLSALRTDFVAAVSHELRTPIASIRMLSELLAEGTAEPDEHDEMHHALAREAKRLGSTVDRLLGFSRMQAGKNKARLAKGCVGEVARRVVATFEERHPDVEVERELDMSLHAPLDADALAMALDNLLENARKYAPEGAPYRVTVRAKGGGVSIAVVDHGPGISRRDQKRIFRPFERADDRLSEATEGSGIGLSLVRHVARAHGGRVELDSAPGAGATFIIWIPNEEAEA